VYFDVNAGADAEDCIRSLSIRAAAPVRGRRRRIAEDLIAVGCHAQRTIADVRGRLSGNGLPFLARPPLARHLTQSKP
jgi:hypothetical protein